LNVQSLLHSKARSSKQARRLKLKREASPPEMLLHALGKWTPLDWPWATSTSAQGLS
jgi:hypothetical protein